MTIQPTNCPGQFTIALPEEVQSMPLAYRPGAWYGIADFINYDPCDQSND